MSSFLAIQAEIQIQDASMGPLIGTDGAVQEMTMENGRNLVISIALRCLGECSSNFTFIEAARMSPGLNPQSTALPPNISLSQGQDSASLALYVRGQLPAPTLRPSPLDVVRMTAILRPAQSTPVHMSNTQTPSVRASNARSAPSTESTSKHERQESRLESETPAPKITILSQQPLVPKWIHPIALSLPQSYQDRDSPSERNWEEIEEQEGVGRKKKISVLTPTAEASLPRPVLEPPKIGIFAVYYILTKLGILSDAASHWESKQSIEATDSEMKELYRARIEELKKALEYEKANKLWGLTLKMMNWMMALTSIIAGVTLVMSGIGTIAGALLIAGGILALTNQIFEVTGVWNKIAEKLPTNSEEKREATIHWMRIGIAILCLVLSCAGALGAGWGALNEAMGNFMAVFGGVVMMASGVCTIGQGVTISLHKDRLSRWVSHQRRLAMLKHRREDLVEGLEHGVERMKQLFIDLAKLLDFESEIVRASQPMLSH